MRSAAKDQRDSLDSLPEERKTAVEKVLDVLLVNLPEGFEEGMGYDMVSYHMP